MSDSISKNVIEQANNFIESKFGIYFPEKRTKDFLRALSNAAKQKNVKIEEYIYDMVSNKLSHKELEDLVICITIGETYFFRDKKLFQIVREKILQNIIISRKNTSKTLKIWSAGCSTGEEAYSIAILIKELIPDYEDWNIKIIATDINENFLNRAKNGIYGEWSFRGLNESFKKKYFDRINNNQYKIKDSISKLVEFHNLNLVSDIYLLNNKIINNIDIIFCRNVLIYFNKYRAQKIINHFYKSLINEGWLIVAPAENLYINSTCFIPVNINDTFLYNKNTSIDKVEKVIYKKDILENSLIEQEINKYGTLKNDLRLISKNTSIPLKTPEKETKISIKKLKNLCQCLANEGKLHEALECCKKIICEEKTNPTNYYLLASIQEEQGNIVEAIISLKRAIYLDSDFIMAYFNLGNLNLKQQKLKEAFKNFKISLILLGNFNEEDIVPHSGETTVGMLKQVIENVNCIGDLYGKM